MELKGERNISTDRATVWSALNDPEVLKRCIPGCTELTGSPEDGFDAKVTQKVGPVKANFAGAVVLSDVVAGESYTIIGEGKGGVAGFAKGAANVQLTGQDIGTKLTYAVDAKVGGKLAQLGSRLIGRFAAKMADQFFEKFQEIVEQSADAPSGSAALFVTNPKDV